MHQLKRMHPLAVAASMISICLLTIVIMNACRKVDRLPERNPPKDYTADFFNVSADAPSYIKRIVAKAKKDNDVGQYVNELVKKAGLPDWQKTVSFLPPKKTGAAARTSAIDPENDTLTFVPFKKIGSQQVTSFLACAVGEDSVTMKLFRGDLYPAYDLANKVNARFDTISSDVIASYCSYLEFLGDNRRDEFRINDRERLFKYDERPEKGSTFIKVQEPIHSGYQEHLSSSHRMEYFSITVCVSVQVFNYEGQLVGFGPNDQPNWTTTQTDCYTVGWWMNVISDPDGFVYTGPNTGGGSGGNQWYDDPPPCRTVPGSNYGPCTGTPGGGWTPVVDYEEYNPYIEYDSVIVSQGIKDSFPCAEKLIKEELYKVNQLVQVGMHDFFKLNMASHIRYEIDWTLGKDSAIGRASKYPHRQTINNVLHWTDTIFLNPWYLSHSSKEAIIGTVIHESIHAYIMWCINDYIRYGGTQPGYTVDSFYLKEHFGIYWNYLVNRPYDQVHHDVMVSQYIQYIADVIFTFGNMSAPRALRQFVALNIAKGGLQKTAAWGQAGPLNDTCLIRHVNYWADNFHGVFGGAAPNILPCGTTDVLYRDSLQMLKGDSCQ